MKPCSDVGRGRPPEERGHIMIVNIYYYKYRQEIGCDSGMLIAVYKCLFGYCKNSC